MSELYPTTQALVELIGEQSYAITLARAVARIRDDQTLDDSRRREALRALLVRSSIKNQVP